MSFPCLRCSDLSHCLVEVFGNWEAATTKNQKTLQGHWWAHTYATTFHAPSSQFLFFGIILGKCLKPGQFLVYHAETPWGDASRAIAEQTASVHGFFGHLYWSAAESMPVQFLPTVQKNPLVKLQRCWFSGPLYSFCSYYFSGFKLPLRFQSTSALAQSDEQLREQLQARLVEQRLLGATRQVTELRPHNGLPQRELPPGTVSSLYLMYLGYARATDRTPAGRTTFYNAWQQWKICMKFRPETSHSMCLQCQTLKAKIHDASEALLNISSSTDFTSYFFKKLMLFN